MKKIFISLLFLLSGCYTTSVIKDTPVSDMADWELRNEYKDLQIQQLHWEGERMFGELDSSSYQTGLTTTTLSSNRAIKKLNKVEKRLREVEYEMTMRGILP